jgi:hypothetical protein
MEGSNYGGSYPCRIVEPQKKKSITLLMVMCTSMTVPTKREVCFADNSTFPYILL